MALPKRFHIGRGAACLSFLRDDGDDGAAAEQLKKNLSNLWLIYENVPYFVCLQEDAKLPKNEHFAGS